MACKLPGFVGRDVALEFGLACGDVDPRLPGFNWTPFASMRTKEMNLTWDTADASSDSSVNSLRENLATFLAFEISGDGVAKQSVNGEPSAFTTLTKHVANPGPEFSNQPVVWLRLTFPDLTFIAYMLVSELSRSAPYDDVVTFSLTAAAASSDFGLIVLDTPDPSVVPASVTLSAAGPIEMKVADKLYLSASVLPANAVQRVNWSSGTEATATVDANGQVSALAAGSTVIRAESQRDNTKFDTVTVTVVA